MITTIALLILVYLVVLGALWQSCKHSELQSQQQVRHLEMVTKMQDDISRLTEALVRANGNQVVLRRTPEAVPTAGWYDEKPPEKFTRSNK